MLMKKMRPEERTYRVTPKSVFDYPRYPKYVFIQDGPYRPWRCKGVSDLLQKVQETAHVTFEEWYERTGNVEPYGDVFRGKGQLEEEKMLRREDLNEFFPRTIVI